MKEKFLIAFAVIDVCACIFNLTTLQFVVKSFNLKTHVFTLLFIDSLSSTICSIASVVFDTIFLTKPFEPNFISCSFAFFAAYLPNSFGSILTFLIAVTRYFLTKKAAKNIHPNNKKVTLAVLGIFTSEAGFIIVFFFVNLSFNISSSYYINACAYPEQDQKQIPLFVVLFLLHPNVCNMFSLLTDLQMLRFLKTVILPSNSAQNHGAGTILQYYFEIQKIKFTVDLMSLVSYFDSRTLNFIY